jgi:polysaccharide export outer membrane protein
MSLIRYFPIFLFCALTPVSIETQEVPRMGELSLVPGDILRVIVWREEDLSGDFQVDQDGKIILPLLGEVPVDDKKWDEVRDWLLQEYRKELRNPSIELTPFRSVYVLGEVNLPGRYNIHPTNDNLAGALSLAGGISPDGDIRNLRVVRDGVMVLDGIPVEQGLAQLGIKSGDQLFVGRRGWIDRNSTFIVSAVLSVSSIVVAILTASGG